MDAQSSPEKIVDPPRHLFFGVEDRRVGGRAGLADKYLGMEKGRRHQLAETVINSAIQVANAVRTLRTFDRTGNADQVLDHLSASLEDLVKQANNLIEEVEKSVERYGDGLDALTARDAADATTALDTPAAVEPSPQAPTAAGPKPGPRPWPTTIHADHDDVESGREIQAQVKANLNRALDRATR